jgi:hypothetical protein
MPFQQTELLLQRLQHWGYLPLCPVPLWVALPLTLPACGGCGGRQPPVLSPSSLGQPAFYPASLWGCHVGASVPKVSGLREAGCWLVLEAPVPQCVWAAGHRLHTQWSVNALSRNLGSSFAWKVCPEGVNNVGNSPPESLMRALSSTCV